MLCLSLSLCVRLSVSVCVWKIVHFRGLILLSCLLHDRDVLLILRSLYSVFAMACSQYLHSQYHSFPIFSILSGALRIQNIGNAGYTRGWATKMFLLSDPHMHAHHDVPLCPPSLLARADSYPQQTSPTAGAPPHEAWSPDDADTEPCAQGARYRYANEPHMAIKQQYITTKETC